MGPRGAVLSLGSFGILHRLKRSRMRARPCYARNAHRWLLTTRVSASFLCCVNRSDLDLQDLFALSIGVRSRVTNKSCNSLILGP